MSSFASGKFAMRATAQSLAREFGPKGVHVAHAIIDGVIDIPRTKDWPVNGGVEDGKISSEAVSLILLCSGVEDGSMNWGFGVVLLTSSRLQIRTGICTRSQGHISHRRWIVGHS